jgi:hypothetical protein
MLTRACLALCLLACASPAWADSVNISDRGGTDVGYCEDNYTSSVLNPNDNGGGATSGYTGVNLGEWRALWRFDLSSIADTATITAASINFYGSHTGLSFTGTLCRIADANNDWVEGTANWTTETGASCWNKKIYNTTNWAGSAGLSTATTDYINTSLGTVTLASTGSKTLTLNAAGVTAIQNRLASDDIEFILFNNAGDGSFFQISSSENATAANRPQLSVTYTPAAAGQVICVTIF